MILTHKIEIRPNKTVINMIHQCFGYSRYCYNKGLEVWNNEYNSGNKPNGRSVRDMLKSTKQDWEKELSPNILDNAIDDLEKGFKLFYKGISRHPRFKSKRKSRNSFRFNRKNDSTIRIINNKLCLPKFPYPIKLTEKIRYKGTIKQCTITKEANKYYTCFVIDTVIEPIINNRKTYVGVDLGIKEFAIIGYGKNNNRKFKHFKGRMKDLKKLYSKISHYQKMLSRKHKDSNKYQATRAKLQILYKKIVNIQKDYLNKITTFLCKKFKHITIEDLNVSGMIKNRKLSKVISRSLFYTFKIMLEYKKKLYDNIIILADRFYPSTQICSHCGNRRERSNKLKLSERVYICNECGVISDRDENASYNLKLYGQQWAGLQPL